MRRKQNDAAAKPMPIYFVASADGKTPVNNPANIHVYLRKNGGGEAAAAGAVAAGGARGWHWWSPAAADVDTLGECSVVAIADNCDPFPFVFSVEPTTVAEDAAKIRRIGTPSALVLSAVDDGGTITIYIGDDNKASLAKEIPFEIETTLDLDDPAQFTLTLGAGPKDGGSSFIVVASSVTQVDVDKYRVVFQPTKTDNGGMTPYGEYGYTVQATNAAGDESVEIEGVALTRRKWT